MRAVLWAFILWQVFWLNIFIPGHTRGAYGTMGGDSCCAPEVKEEPVSCCSVAAKPATEKHDHGKAPTEDQQRRCAICYIAKGYTVATVFTFDLTLSGRTVTLVETFEPQVTTIAFQFPFYPVGPPQV